MAETRIARVKINGRVARVRVPANATKEQVLAQARRVVPAKPKETSFWQGVAEGLVPASVNAAKVLTRFNPFDPAAVILSGASGNRDQGPNQYKREKEKEFAQSPYRGSTGGRITGGVLATAPTLMIPGAGWFPTILQGMASGALMSKDILDPNEAIPDALVGGLTAGIVKGGTDYVVAPVARAIAQTAPVRKALGAVGVNVRQAPKLSKAERTILKAKPNLQAAAAKMDEARALGLPYVPADADVALRGLAGSARRYASPDKVSDAAEFASSRMADRSTRGLQAIERDFGKSIDTEATEGAVRNLANRRAGPFYDEAFEGGSTAPLKAQLGEAFNATSKEVAEARAALAAAQRGETVSRAAVNRAGNNVYMNAKALPADRAAGNSIRSAEKALADAETRHAAVLEKLRTAQADAATGAPGAVWSPRIQQFIDDPLSKAGLARGLEIQRIEALAQGKAFDPTEYAITGVDEAGAPIVGSVPNLRTLDAIKRGYDAILDDYPRDISGKQVFDQRGRAITMAKQALVKELDDATGGAAGPYAQARAVYGSIASRNTALNAGRKASGPAVESRNVARQIEGMDPKQEALFKRGYVTETTDAIRAARSDTANPYDYLAGGLDRKDKLNVLFPENAPRFLRQRELEKDMSATSQELFGGSATQIRGAADEAFKNDLLNSAMDTGLDIASTGGVMTPGAIANLLRKVKDRGELGLLGTREKADALLPLLTGQGGQQNYRAMTAKMIEEEAQRQAYRRALGGFTAPVTAGLLSF